MGRTLAVVLVAAVLAGCSGSSGGSGDEAGAATTTDAGVPEALGFMAPLIDGGELNARSLAGRPVVFWFWSPY